MISLPIRVLLHTHDKYAPPGALTEVLGDGYLYSYSPLFARIRDAALNWGYRFVEKESGLWHDYLAMPLLSLQTILKSRSIPYFNNMSVLRDLLERQPGIELPARFVYEALIGNHVLHETCHCVAHHVLHARTGVLARFDSENERFVIGAMLEEAFANAVERLASVFPPTKTYAFFSNMNSYMRYMPAKRGLWESALESFGFERLFALAFLSYLNLNLVEPGKPVQIERLIEIVWQGSPPGFHRESLEKLINVELNLSEVFRGETTHAYFRLYGCHPELHSLREANLMENDGFVDAVSKQMDELRAVAVCNAPAPELAGQAAQ